jgi:hypothetical protein
MVWCDPLAESAPCGPDGQAEERQCPGYLPPDWQKLSGLANQGGGGKPKGEIKPIHGQTEKHGRHGNRGQINDRGSLA